MKTLYAHPTAGTDVLRLVLAAIVITHGAERLLSGNAVLGQFLGGLGLPFGAALAQFISLFEVVGGLLLAARRLLVPVGGLFFCLYLASIVLFHRHKGFYVIGPSENGWEFSALLCAGMLATLCEGLQGRLATGRKRVGMDVLRIVLCACIFMHGAHRLFGGHSHVLGDILASKGFPFGLQIIILVNLVETIGALAIARRLMVFPLTLVLICFYAVGIVWFHWHWGFFIVAPGDFKWEPDGWGWEYSLLLIGSLVATSWENRAVPFALPSRLLRAA
ncbi:MAG: DoxX family protein [Pseudomonadota bacterium]